MPVDRHRVHIARLRRKIDGPNLTHLIHTVRGSDSAWARPNSTRPTLPRRYALFSCGNRLHVCGCRPNRCAASPEWCVRRVGCTNRSADAQKKTFNS